MFTAKITDARVEMFLSENKNYMDIWFDILQDEVVVANRRLAFPMGTSEEEITASVKNYCVMFETDHRTAKEYSERSLVEAEAQKVFDGLKGLEIK